MASVLDSLIKTLRTENMENAKHTPGPWARNIKPASMYPVIFAGRNTHIARVFSQGLSEEETEANCNLIAAAPGHLDALMEIATSTDDGEALVAIARAALVGLIED
jgi:hypothetical protein